MRKFLMVVAVGALALLMAAPAMAVDFKFGAEYRVRFYDYANVGFDNQAGTNPRGVQLRVRPIFDASDDNGNITARLRLEYGDTEFGGGGGANGVANGRFSNGTASSFTLAPTNARVGNGAGGSIGNDGVALEVKSAYLDFALPFGVPLRVRSGIQPWYLPKGLIIDDDVIGVRAYGTVAPVSYEVAWYRASRENTGGTAGFTKDNALDFYQAKVDFAVAKVFNPYLYYIYGDNRANCVGQAPGGTFLVNCGGQDRVRPQNWFGVGFTGDFGFLTYDLDWVWGSAKGGPNGALTSDGTATGEPVKVKGWAIDGGVHIPIGPVKLNLVGSYATGDDSDDANKSGAFPGGIGPSWSGPSQVAGGPYELIGAAGAFDVIDAGQDSPTNLWTLGLSVEYLPVKPLTLRLHYLYAGFSEKTGNCANGAPGGVRPGCFGPVYQKLVNKSSLGSEIGLRADYQVWTGFKLQGFAGWLIPSEGDTMGKYILQMLYSF
ncbi:MAG TPA: hypothetical protein VLT62_24675 [Candidatus Methylomirabilis sp.]|nr:hypothetical protein [Candidatus Methylomirabilis sp.]